MFEEKLEKLYELYQSGVFSKPFYSSRIKGPEVFHSYEDFTNIPFMYKKDIRDSKPMDRSSVGLKDAYGFFSSSGSTGKRTMYLYSKKDKAVHEEFVKTYYTELGVEETDIGGVFAPVDSGVMAQTMMWQFTTMGSSYVNLAEPSPDNMIELIQEVPISIIATRPSVVCSFVGNPQYEKIARESSVRMLLLGGGFLTNVRRKVIEKTWNAKCYSMLGMSEVFGPLAGECRFQNGYHFRDDYLMVEVVDPVTYEPVDEGEYGIAIYTTLWDKGFPLLRYWTDDYIKVDTSVCKCGRSLPRLFYKGRLADSLKVEDDYVFPSMLEELLFGNGYFGEYRAIREDKTKILLEKCDDFTVSDVIKDKLDALFKDDIVIDYVEKNELLYDGHGIRFLDLN